MGTVLGNDTGAETGKFGLLASELPEALALVGRTLVRLPAYRELPRATVPGDLVAFLDVGAYSVETMSANNGRPRPEVVMLSPEGAVSTLRRRATYADLIAEDELALRSL